jgi:hypothetical protein
VDLAAVSRAGDGDASLAVALPCVKKRCAWAVSFGTEVAGLRRWQIASAHDLGPSDHRGNTVSMVELFTSFVGTILMTAPAGTVVNPFSCNADWNAR